MKKITLSFAVLISISCYAQREIFRIPLEKKNPLSIDLNLDSGFCTGTLEYHTHLFTFLGRKGAGKISELEYRYADMKNYEGFGKSENERYIYFFQGPSHDTKVITLFEDSRKPIVGDVSFSEINSNDRPWIAFNRGNIFYKVFKNRKNKELIFCEVNRDQGRMIGKFKLEDKTFKIIEDLDPILFENNADIDLRLMFRDKFYWRGDSIIFSYHHKIDNAPKKDTHHYLSLKLSDNSVSDRILCEGEETHRVDDYLLDDKFFVLIYYRDELIIDIKDANSLKTIKRHKMNEESGPNLISTPYMTTYGDTLGAKWKKEDIAIKTIKSIGEREIKPFLLVQKESNDTYQFVIGSQIIQYSTTPGVGGGVMVSGSLTDNVKYFKGCLTSELEPVQCSEFRDRNELTIIKDKANARKRELQKSVNSLGGPLYYYFKQIVTKSHVYLSYIDRKSEALVIEEF